MHVLLFIKMGSVIRILYFIFLFEYASLLTICDCVEKGEDCMLLRREKEEKLKSSQGLEEKTALNGALEEQSLHGAIVEKQPFHWVLRERSLGGNVAEVLLKDPAGNKRSIQEKPLHGTLVEEKPLQATLIEETPLRGTLIEEQLVSQMVADEPFLKRTLREDKLILTSQEANLHRDLQDHEPIDGNLIQSLLLPNMQANSDVHRSPIAKQQPSQINGTIADSPFEAELDSSSTPMRQLQLWGMQRGWPAPFYGSFQRWSAADWWPPYGGFRPFGPGYSLPRYPEFSSHNPFLYDNPRGWGGYRYYRRT